MTDARRAKTKRRIACTAAAIGFALLSAASTASTTTWKFTTRAYDDFAGLLAPLATGTLITSDTLNEVNQYEILSAFGSIGGDDILGLSSNHNYHDYAPDNSISFNRTDVAAFNGCAGWSYLPIVDSNSAHVSCAGIAFSTASGSVNLSFGGATEVMTKSYTRDFFIVRTQFVQAVPEPSTLLLVATCLLPISVATVRRKRKAIGKHTRIAA